MELVITEELECSRHGCGRKTQVICTVCNIATYCSVRCKVIDMEIHRRICHPEVSERILKYAHVLSYNGGYSVTYLTRPKYMERYGIGYEMWAFGRKTVCGACQQGINNARFEIFMTGVRYDLCEECHAAGRRLCPRTGRLQEVCEGERRAWGNRLTLMRMWGLPVEIRWSMFAMVCGMLKCTGCKMLSYCFFHCIRARLAESIEG